MLFACHNVQKLKCLKFCNCIRIVHCAIKSQTDKNCNVQYECIMNKNKSYKLHCIVGLNYTVSQKSSHL